MFYVYLHRKAATGEIFYVGKGKDNRAWDKTDRGTHWHRISKKYGYIVEIIQSELQEWYAFELEINMIAYYGRMDLGLGKLINKTDGGDGISGYVHTELDRKKQKDASKIRWSKQEERDKFSTILIGNKRHLGKKHSEESKLKMSVSMKGKKHSEETKNKLSEIHKNRDPKKKKEIYAKISEKFIGNTFAKGLIHSEESKLKMSLSQKGKIRSDKAKLNYRLSRYKRMMAMNNWIFNIGEPL